MRGLAILFKPVQVPAMVVSESPEQAIDKLTSSLQLFSSN